jgi:hypothetical protein
MLGGSIKQYKLSLNIERTVSLGSNAIFIKKCFKIFLLLFLMNNNFINFEYKLIVNFWDSKSINILLVCILEGPGLKYKYSGK